MRNMVRRASLGLGGSKEPSKRFARSAEHRGRHDTRVEGAPRAPDLKPVFPEEDGFGDSQGIDIANAYWSDDPDDCWPRYPGPRPALLNSHWTRAAFPCPRKNGEIGAAGKPDARPSAESAPFGSSLGQPPSPHGRPSSRFSARRHSHPPGTRAINVQGSHARWLRRTSLTGSRWTTGESRSPEPQS